MDWERESEFLPLLNNKDKVTLQELYDEMFTKRSSGPLYTKDDLLQRIEKVLIEIVMARILFLIIPKAKKVLWLL